jgi:hypothetical protein
VVTDEPRESMERSGSSEKRMLAKSGCVDDEGVAYQRSIVLLRVVVAVDLLWQQDLEISQTHHKCRSRYSVAFEIGSHSLVLCRSWRSFGYATALEHGVMLGSSSQWPR